MCSGKKSTIAENASRSVLTPVNPAVTAAPRTAIAPQPVDFRISSPFSNRNFQLLEFAVTPTKQSEPPRSNRNSCNIFLSLCVPPSTLANGESNANLQPPPKIFQIRKMNAPLFDFSYGRRA
jgi:hypothetical protein